MTYTHTGRAREGFTLVEILVALAIIAVLGTLVAPNLLKYVTGSKDTTTKSNLRAIKTAIDQFYADMGDFPSKLRDLVKKPADEQLAKKWKDRYLDSNEVPTDGWQTPFQYKKPGEKGHPYELYSYGPNKKGAPKSEWISVWEI